MADYDSAWKEALDVYFEAFLALFYPLIHADVDWSRGFVFLDKELFRVIDWPMELPPNVDERFKQELFEYVKGRQMPYVTSIERVTMVQMIASTLRARFGEEGAALAPTIREINDAEKYLALNEFIVKATSLEEVRRACSKAAAAIRRKKNLENKRNATQNERAN